MSINPDRGSSAAQLAAVSSLPKDIVDQLVSLLTKRQDPNYGDTDSSAGDGCDWLLSCIVQYNNS